ncbi:MAG: DUF1800 domain-containing protein [Acidobacteriaceae bacterium]
MKKRTLGVAALVAACTMWCGAAVTGAAGQKVTETVTHTGTLTQRQQAEHILDRFTFGPTPGEVDTVARMGWRKWLAEQMHPDAIADTQLDERLMQYPSLGLTPPELLAAMPSNLIIRQIALGRAPYSRDWMVGGMEQVLVWKFQQKKVKGKSAKKRNSAQDAPMMLPNGEVAAQNVTDADTNPKIAQRAEAQQLADQVLAAPANERMADIMRLPVEQRAVLAEAVWGRERNELLQGFTPREREIFIAMGRGPNATVVADNELQQDAILRAVLSQRQLQEVMTEFWFNHFNVYMLKGADQWYTPSYVRDVIRPYALGKFPNLLIATAQSPAMLFYLDNWLSIGANSPAARRMDARNHQPHGINENYGREVMELHTVGVEGGYTQADVIALANILTGWTIDRPLQGGGATYDPARHEPGSIHWYGHTVQDNGYEEGREALLWLAAQPSTAHHISYELAQRFVADDPPPALVNAMAATYMRTGGDIKQILWTMVNSPQFWQAKDINNKVKTPLEFVASAFRATGTDPGNPEPLVYVLRQMGEPLFLCLTPNGYPLTGDAWMNTGALMARMNFAMQFAQGKLGDGKFDPRRALADDAQVMPAAYSAEEDDAVLKDLPALEMALLGRRASAKTEGVIERQVERMPHAASEQKLRVMTALLLGSPDFQMR